MLTYRLQRTYELDQGSSQSRIGIHSSLRSILVVGSIIQPSHFNARTERSVIGGSHHNTTWIAVYEYNNYSDVNWIAVTRFNYKLPC